MSRLLAADPWSRGLGVGVDAGLLSAGSAGARWLIDGTQLAKDNAIGRSTAYRYLHEHRRPGCRRAGLHGALVSDRAAAHAHVTVDGVLIRTDRVRVSGPTVRANRPECGVDLWWSGKHGGNVQVIAAYEGWPIRTILLYHRHGRNHMITDRAQPLPGMAQSPDEPRPTSLFSRPGRIDIRVNAANHPHHSTHRGLFVIGGLCHPANGDHSPSR